MPWLIFALFSAILNTTFSLLSRVLSVKSENPRAFSVIFSIFSALFSLVFFIFEPFYINSITLVIFVLTIASSIFYAVHNRTQFYASKYLEASTSTIIRQLSPVIGFIAAILLLDENVTSTKLLAAGFIILGNIIAIYKNSSVQFNRGLFYALAGAVSVGLAFVFDKVASAYYSIPVYSFLIYLLTAIYNYFLPLLPRKSVEKELVKAKWQIALLAVINVTSYYFLLNAYRLAEASLVIPVTASSTVLTVIAGMLILKERSRPYQKIIAMICTFIGIILINH